MADQKAEHRQEQLQGHAGAEKPFSRANHLQVLMSAPSLLPLLLDPLETFLFRERGIPFLRNSVFLKENDA